MPPFKIHHVRLSEITDIETIGKVKNPYVRDELNQKFGKAKWIYKKGTAKIELPDNGNIWIAEIHFFTAHGKDICKEVVKCLIKRIYE
ncbi:hypothetical protein WDW89_17315 [Deltaproteobacteria bacterium TL4]